MPIPKLRAIQSFACAVLLGMATPLVWADEPNPAGLVENPAHAEFRRLTTLWAKLASEIKSAHVQADHFIYHPKNKLGTIETDLLITGMEVLLIEMGTRTAELDKLTAKLPETNLLATWRTMELYINRDQRRILESWTDASGRLATLEAAFDGAETRFVNPDGTTNPKSMSGDNFGNLIKLQKLRSKPWRPPAGLLTLENLPGGQLRRISGPQESITVFVDSGIVFEWSTPKHRTLHYDPTRFEGGVTFPRLTINAVMDGGNLLLLNIYRIRSAQFNLAMDPSATELKSGRR